MKGDIPLADFVEFKNELMEDPEFPAEYESTRPEYELMRALVDARINSNMNHDHILQIGGE